MKHIVLVCQAALLWMPVLLPAQPITFSPDIVIDTSSALVTRQRWPVINLDRQGNIGIIYTEDMGTGQSDTAFARYIRSSDGGQTFYGKTTIDRGSWDGMSLYCSSLVYDTLNNPIVSYAFFHWPSRVFIKKSHNGGGSFGNHLFAEWTYLHPGLYLSFDENNILYGVFPGIEDTPVVIKSYDQGMTYPERYVVPTDSVYVAPEYISLVKCGNGDLLCFYSGIKPNLFNNVHIFYSRSMDGGMNWENETLFDSTSNRSTWPTVISNGNKIYVAYFLYTGNSGQILFRKSIDNGISFGPPFLISEMITNNGNPTPDIAFHPEVGICVTWQKTVSPNMGVRFSISTDGGDSFSTPINVNNGLHYRANNTMAISDNREIFVVSEQSASKQIVLNKAQAPLAIEQEAVMPEDLRLQVWPNPFNSNIQISIGNHSEKIEKIRIYNLLGEMVESLPVTASRETWRVDFSGKNISSGIYIIRIEGKYFQYSQKILYLK